MTALEILSGLGSIALIVGIGVGLLQLRIVARQRQEEMVIRAYGPFMDTDFARAYWRVQSWTYTTFEAFDAVATLEDWATFDQVATFFETMGILYKRGLARLDLLDDLMAGSLLTTWRKMAPIVRGYRIKADVPDYAQWFERLAGALDRRLVKLGEVEASTAEPG